MASGEAMDVRVVEMIEQDEMPSHCSSCPNILMEMHTDSPSHVAVCFNAHCPNYQLAQYRQSFTGKWRVPSGITYSLREREAANKANDPS